MKSMFARALLILALTTPTAVWAVDPVMVQVSCYTERVTLPTKRINLEADPDIPGYHQFIGPVGRIGNARLLINVAAIDNGGELRVADAYLFVKAKSKSRRTSEVEFAQGGLVGNGNSFADAVRLPDSRIIRLLVGHELLKPLDFNEGNLTCELQF